MPKVTTWSGGGKRLAAGVGGGFASQLCRGLGLHIQHALLSLTEVRRILRAAITAAGPCSRDAWFLMILCLISLLKCVLARLFLDVNFQVTFLTHNYHFGHGYGHFWYPNLSFGRPGAPLWHPGGPWDDPGDTWEHKKGDLGIQACIFIDFGWILGPHSERFSGTLDQHRVFFHACCQVTFCNDSGV